MSRNTKVPVKRSKIAFKTQLDNILRQGLITTQQSRVRPDDHLSIQQLMENHTNGIPLSTSPKEPFYTEDMDIPKNMDIIDHLQNAKDQRQTKTLLEKEEKNLAKQEKNYAEEQVFNRFKEEQLKTAPKSTETT